MLICLIHACMIGNMLLNRKSCILRDMQTLLFRVSTLFTLEIGRQVCMVREALASNFVCACFVRLQVRSARFDTF